MKTNSNTQFMVGLSFNWIYIPIWIRTIWNRDIGILKTIRDPEKPSTLEDLKVVYEDGIFIQPPTSDNVQVVSSKCFNLFSQCISNIQHINSLL